MSKIGISILSGIFMGLVIGIYLAFTSKTDIAIVVGVFTAVVSPVILYFKILYRTNTKLRFQKMDKKSIIYSGPASCFNKGISVGGTLYLLNDKLIFQTNLINYTNRHQIILDLDEISKVSFVDTFGWIKNGLLIEMENKNEQFIVNKREIWKENIERQLSME